MIDSIWIKSFRCLSELTISFSNHSLIPIIARNNVGKTSILEACYILGNLKSFVTNDISQIVPFSQPSAYLGVKIPNVYRSNNYYLKVDNFGKKYITLNDRPVKKKAEIMSLFRSHYISSDSLLLITSTPSFRRTKLDQVISQFSQSYRHNLGTYKRLISQKNKLLRSGEYSSLFNQINQQLAALIFEIRKERLFYLKELNNRVKHYLQQVKIIDKDFSIEYQSETIEYESENDILTELNKRLYKERVTKVSTFGPHRDDYVFQIDGRDINLFFSRGICRIIGYFFQLSMVDIVSFYSKLPILLLLDEPFSEVYHDIKEVLIHHIPKDYAIIYTTTQDNELRNVRNDVSYTIDNGTLCKI